MKKLKIYCSLLAFLLLTACGNIMPGMHNPDTSQMMKVNNPETNFKPVLTNITSSLIESQKHTLHIYRVAPTDILNIVVWNHPEFSPKELYANQISSLPNTQGAAGREGYLVSQNGTIYFPLVGTVKVSEKTLDEIRIDLTQRLKKYLKHPELNVRVVDFRAKKVYVFGEVLKPNFIPITDQTLSITDAISISGGFDPNASDTSHIYVIRGTLYRPYVYWLNAKTPESLLLAENFMLKPNDILYVSSAPATRWNRVLNQLLPTIQTIWYTKSIVDNR